MKNADAGEETVYLEVAGRSMDVHVAVPPGPGPHPAVLLMFHRGGLDACTAHYFKEFPKAGYLTVVPNFYHHCPKDVPLHDCKKFLKDNEVIAEIAAAADYALSRPDTDRSRFSSPDTAWAAGCRFSAPAPSRYSPPPSPITAVA